MSERVFAYIDGFNLYFGLKDRGWKKLYWLDVALLAENLLREGQRLDSVRYFTARISGPPDKQRRQNVFLEANEALGKCTLHYGQYLKKFRRCPRCGYRHAVPEEKMTDVNIAVEMLADAVEDRFDTALLISADSDLTPPVEKIQTLFPDKRIVAAFPPKRNSYRLASAANAHFTIGRKRLSRSLLPETIKKDDGFVIRRPREWR